MRNDPIRGYLLGIPASLAATACFAAPIEIGTATTVIPSAESEASGTIVPLEPGANIFQDELIRTYKIGAANLKFADKTTLTVYPNTQVKLDRFVYNPDKTVSEVALSMAKGAFRLATGSTRTSERYTLKTPHVTLGIRGTVVHVVADDKSSVVQALHGAFEGCSTASGICKLVQATDVFNGAQFWVDGRVEISRFPINLGVRDASGTSSIGAGAGAPLAVARVGTIQAQVTPPVTSGGSFFPAPTPSVAPRRAAVVAQAPSFSAGPAPRASPSHAICFVRGMRVLTPEGEVNIEELRVGDEVVTHSSGVQKVKWIPRQVFTREPSRAWGSKVAPIRIEANALSQGCPNRPLLLSPTHALFFDDILIPAHLLVNGRTIRQVDYSGEMLEYFNVELEEHAIINVNGVAVETYYPEEERARENWSNYFEYAQLYPERLQRQFGPVVPVLQGGSRMLLRARARSLIAPLVDRRGRLELVRDGIASRARAA